MTRAEVVVCGAGLAGIAAAYHLAVERNVSDVVLVDERPPLTLTSDKSTECYRNWWPGPDDAMVRLMNRSIDLMDGLARETRNAFSMSRRGYVYATRDRERARRYERQARLAEAQGAGSLRVHRGEHADYRASRPEGFDEPLTGADLLVDHPLIRRHFPYLSDDVVAVLHARRCGWLSAQQLGMLMLERARAKGARLLRGRVDGVDARGGAVRGVHVAQRGRMLAFQTRAFVNAAGPFVGAVGRTLGVELPVFSELHLKLAFQDVRRVVPREAPMLILDDPVRLPWNAEERALIAEYPDERWLLDPLPAGAHARPEGGSDSPTLLILWPYHAEPVKPDFPFRVDPQFAELALRGLAELVPGMSGYLSHIPKPVIDGGYYTKTRENRPLIGPLPVQGAYAIGALSGFGIMAACAAGELLAAHVAGDALPSYAPAFAPDRYEDPAYRKRIAEWDDSGQL